MAATVRLNAIISIHALLAEGDGDVKLIVDLENISIHALLAEGDLLPDWDLYQMLRISIHALLAEGDFVFLLMVAGYSDFYPRPPCGGRRCSPSRTCGA